MLHAHGIKAVVYEQASEVSELGVGINTLPHAIERAVGARPAAGARRGRYPDQGADLPQSSRPGGLAGAARPRCRASEPQFSIHRGRLQKVLHAAVIERLGPGSVRTGRRLAGFMQDEGGVTAHFVDAHDGLASETVRAEVLIAADGIHSVVRRHFYPAEGAPSWQGVMLWRGAADAPAFLTGSSMYHRRRHGREARALSDRRGRGARRAG